MGRKTLKTAVVAILLVLAICSSLVVFAACNDEGGDGSTEMTSEELFAFYRQKIVDMGYTIFREEWEYEEHGVVFEWAITGIVSEFDTDIAIVAYAKTEQDAQMYVNNMLDSTGISMEEFNELSGWHIIIEGRLVFCGFEDTVDTLAELR